MKKYTIFNTMNPLVTKNKLIDNNNNNHNLNNIVDPQNNLINSINSTTPLNKKKIKYI